MKAYLASLAVGVLAGLLYGLLGVRSPAPPVIALVSLLGLLVGEQVPSLLRQLSPASEAASAPRGASTPPVHRS